MMWLRRRRAKSKPKCLYGNLIASMRSTLESEPSNHALRLALVTHLEKAGRYDEAIEQVLILLGKLPGHRRAKGLLLRLKLEQRLALIHRGG